MFSVIVQLDDFFGITVKTLAFFSQRYLLAETIEQKCVQGLFEQLYMGCDGGLSVSQELGSLRKIAQFDNADEGFELTDFQRLTTFVPLWDITVYFSCISSLSMIIYVVVEVHRYKVAGLGTEGSSQQ